MIGSILLSTVFKNRNDKKEKEKAIQNGEVAEEAVTVNHTYSFFTGELFLVWGLMIFALYAIINSLPHEFLGGIFPIAIGGMMLLFGGLLSMQLISKNKQKDVLAVAVTQNGRLTSEWKNTWANFLILPIFLFGTWIFGFIPSLTILFIFIIKSKMGSSWLRISLITGCAIGFLLFVSNLMTLHLPVGLLGELVF